MRDDDEDAYLPEDDEPGEIVRWCDRPHRPLTAAQATGAGLGVFALGALSAVATLMLLGRIRS